MSEEKEPSPELQAILEVFASAESSVDDRRAAFSALVDAKKPAQLARHHLVRDGLNWWLRTAVQGGAAELRLLAISEAMRVGQTFRVLLDDVKSVIPDLLAQQWASASCLASSADRLNIARAIEGQNATWLADYCAEAVVNEESGENARLAFMKLLLADVSSISLSLQRLANAASLVRFETENPGDSAARRFVRIAAALDASMRDKRQSLGNSFGTDLHAFVRALLQPHGTPSLPDLAIEVLKGAALLVVTAVRSKFTVATDSETYSVIRYLRGAYWKSTFSKDALGCLDELRECIEEALVLLCKQGIASQALLDRLALLCGGLPAARSRTAALADQDPSLPEDIRHWLRRGTLPEKPQTSEDVQETILLKFDELVAEALRVYEVTGGTPERRQMILESVAIISPELEPDLLQLIDVHVRVRAAIKSMASARAMDLMWTPGDKLEFMPKYFDAKRALRDNKCTVVVPAVIRLTSDGKPGACILKGEIE